MRGCGRWRQAAIVLYNLALDISIDLYYKAASRVVRKQIERDSGESTLPTACDTSKEAPMLKGMVRVRLRKHNRLFSIARLLLWGCCVIDAAIVLICSIVTAATEKNILVYRSKKIFLVQRSFKEAADVDNDQDQDLVQN